MDEATLTALLEGMAKAQASAMVKALRAAADSLERSFSGQEAPPTDAPPPPPPVPVWPCGRRL